jgi:mannosyltransferase
MSTATSDTSRSKPIAATRAKGPRLDLILLGVITLTGTLLRIPSLSDSLMGDELATYFVVTEHGLGRIIDIVQGDQEVTPPLYLILAGLTQGIGDPMTSLRWVPMLAGVACIPLTYLLGTWTVGRRAALTGAAVAALSPFLIFYATEARAYSLLMLLSLGATLALIKAVNEDGSRWWWGLYALLSCAVMYTHYTGAFVLIGQAAWALVYHWGQWKWLIGSNVIAAVGWIPWLSSYRADQNSPGAEIIGILQPFGIDSFKTDVLHWAVSHPITLLSVRDVPGDAALSFMALGLAVGLVGTVAQARGRIRPRLPTEGVTLVLVLALSTPVLAALYSAVSLSVFLPRNLIGSSPGLALAFALVVTSPRSRRVWAPATALLLTGFAVAGARMLEEDSHRPDYKGVVSFIKDRGGSAAVTVDSPGPAPGPVSQLDPPFAPGEANPRGPMALRLSRPTSAAQLRASRPGGPGQFAALPIPSPESVARQAVRRAKGGTIFLVTPSTFSFAELRGEVPANATAEEQFRAAVAGDSDVGAFVRALPPRYRARETKVFPGLFGPGALAVYVLRVDEA